MWLMNSKASRSDGMSVRRTVEEPCTYSFSVTVNLAYREQPVPIEQLTSLNKSSLRDDMLAAEPLRKISCESRLYKS